jgi:hypothetical protein
LKSEPIAECSQCGKPFYRTNSMQTVCGRMCATRMVKAKRAQERADFNRRKEDAKTLPELREEARKAFHKYIRTRDTGRPCICCGKPMPWGESTPGGYIDAGHFMSRGSCPELAFDPENVSAQLKSCNQPGGTTRASFRAGMIERWGLDVVERLEGPNPPRRFRKDDYRAIRDTYRAKLKELKE